MYSAEKNLYETDFVYNELGSDEFKNLHIVLKMDNDKLKLILNSNTLIEKAELANIIKILQNDYFKKLKIEIIEECEVNLKVLNENYLIGFKDESEINNITPIL